MSQSNKTILVDTYGQVVPLVVTSSDWDMTQVVSAVLRVQRPDRSQVTWTASISAQTSVSLRLSHLLAPGDVAQTGQWQIAATLITADGTVISTPADRFVVVSPFS
jgi:hypothetical protein